MRADRLLNILLLLQAQGRQTAEALAERLEVSVRTIHRDMEALGMAGVPVVATRGAGGGWALLEPWRTDLTGLGAAELQALLVPADGPLLQDLGLASAREAAFAKLLAALPSGRRGEGEAWRRVLVDPTTWRGARAETSATFATLQEAVFKGRRLAMTYTRADGTVSEREVGPLGLVAKGTTWYLVALSGEELRTFNAARVQAARVLPEPVAPPSGFDLAAYWAASKAEFVAALPRFELTARVATALVPRLSAGGRFVRIDALGEPDEDGWREAKFRCDTEEEAIAFSLGHGPQLEVLTPPELRRVVAERAAQTAAFYAAPR